MKHTSLCADVVDGGGGHKSHCLNTTSHSMVTSSVNAPPSHSHRPVECCCLPLSCRARVFSTSTKFIPMNRIHFLVGSGGGDMMVLRMLYSTVRDKQADCWSEGQET